MSVVGDVLGAILVDKDRIEFPVKHKKITIDAC